MSYNTTGASAGSASGIGFYELATSYFKTYLHITVVPIHSNDYIKTEQS